MRGSAPGQTEISVIVPTLNEASNLPALLGRIAAALKGRSYEVLIVDDASEDETVEVCARLRPRHPVFLHVRPKPIGGLSGAAVYGLSRARGEYLVVMDADLQHPPEQLPELLEPLEQEEVEFVIGSRYVAGGSIEQRWGALRRINSAVATLLARPLAGTTRDPMSGFFALRADTFQRAGPLNPLGYKLALELLCKCRVRRVREVPIRFGLRQAGSSKLTLRQQLHFLDHLSRLYDFCFPRAASWLKFLIANACGWLIAFRFYVRLVAHDVNPFLAPTVAFAAVVFVTALFHMRFVRTHDGRRRSWIDFALLALGQWSVCALSARWVAQHAMHVSVGEVFLLTFGAAALASHVLRERLPEIRKGGSSRKEQGAEQHERTPFRRAA